MVVKWKIDVSLTALLNQNVLDNQITPTIANHTTPNSTFWWSSRKHKCDGEPRPESLNKLSKGTRPYDRPEWVRRTLRYHVCFPLSIHISSSDILLLARLLHHHSNTPFLCFKWYIEPTRFVFLTLPISGARCITFHPSPSPFSRS